jgi:hypothetical protein
MGREGGGERGDLVEEFPPPSSSPHVTVLGEEVKKAKDRRRCVFRRYLRRRKRDTDAMRALLK